DDRPVVHPERGPGRALEEDLLDQPAHRSSASAVLHRDPLPGLGRDRHADLLAIPYSCQMRHVPSLLTMQAPTGLSGTHSAPNSAQSLGFLSPDMMSPHT